MVVEVPRGYVQAYGLAIPPSANGTPRSPLEIEFICFLMGGVEGISTKYDHCRNIIGIIWPDLEIHRWLERTLRNFCQTNFTGLTGCKNSAKSFGMGLWALISWWAAPVDTTVFVTSTTNKDAEQRVWGEIEKLFRMKAVNMPGRVMSSTHMIVLRDVPEDVLNSPRSAIILIAAGEKDALERLQGKKNKRMILEIDEGQNVDNQLEEAFYNLEGNEHFEIRCAGNPTNIFDLHGRFCEPTIPGGHDNDLESLEEWPIAPMKGMVRGTCVHFNNVDSPNYDRLKQGLPLLPYLPTPAKVANARAHLGREDEALWRQNIGIWPRGFNVKQTVFTEAELSKFKVHETVQFVSSTWGLGIDPSYTESGDKFCARPVEWGLCIDGVSRVQFHPVIQIPSAVYYEEDGSEHRGPFAQAKRVRDVARERGIPAKYVGVDDTGRNPIKAILDVELGGETLGVGFGDGASDELTVSILDETTSKDAYADKGTEMWYSLRRFAENDQVRGMTDLETRRQLAGRKFEMRARGKVKLESKADYKKRTGGQSPDEADASAVAIAVVRERMGGEAGLAIIEERRVQWRQDARVAARVAPPRLQGQTSVARGLVGQKGVGKLQR